MFRVLMLMMMLVEVVWYHNGKAVIITPNIRILTSEDRSVLQIKKCEIDDFGFYVCKLITPKLTVESRAKLSISSTETVGDDDVSEDVILPKKEDSPKKEKVKRTIRVKKQKPDQTSTTGFKKQIEKESQKTMVKTKREELSTGTLEQTTTINIITKEDLTIEEVEADERTTSFKFADIDNLKRSADVTNILNSITAPEFAAFEAPLRELATIAFLVRTGITVTEVMTLYNEKHFPSLQTTEVQAALVQLLERQGYAAYVTEVLSEEAETDETFVASTVGFRAFMRLIETEAVTVEEIISHFAAEDFVSQEWKMEQTQEVCFQS